VRRWIRDNALWLATINPMVASPGLDGAYMARWMTDLPGLGGAAVLGYVLNTTADLSGTAITYYYGRLQQDASRRKREGGAFVLANLEEYRNGNP